MKHEQKIFMKIFCGCKYFVEVIQHLDFYATSVAVTLEDRNEVVQLQNAAANIPYLQLKLQNAYFEVNFSKYTTGF